MTAGPGEAQGADKAGGKVVAASFEQRFFDLFHGPREIPWLAGPAGGVNARRAAKRRDLKP